MRDNERTKLTAAWLNILAAGVISTGSVAQVVMAASGDRVGPATLAQTLAVAMVFLLVGITLHVIARSLVRSDRAE